MDDVAKMQDWPGNRIHRSCRIESSLISCRHILKKTLMGPFMRNARLAILASTALTLAGAAQSHAADWSGFYVGGNIGYSWGGTITANTTPFTGAVPNGDTFTLPGVTIPLKPGGVVGGGQFGYNWQVGNWVFGFETDLQASGQKDRGQVSQSLVFDCSTTCTAVSSTDLTAKLSWFGTLRTRIGQDFSGLFGYVTGGLSYGEIKLDGLQSISVTGDETAQFQRSFAVSKTKVGWTIGAGVEGQTTWSNWTWRIEYLYIDLGKVNYSDASFSVNSSVTDNILRFVLNYRFAPPPPP